MEAAFKMKKAVAQLKEIMGANMTRVADIFARWDKDVAVARVESPQQLPLPPLSHGLHAVWPSPPWYVPASQLAHVPWLALGCLVPGEQSVGSAAPVEQKAPAGQPTQSSSLVIDRLTAVIVPFWWRPDGHGSGADAPTSQ